MSHHPKDHPPLVSPQDWGAGGADAGEAEHRPAENMSKTNPTIRGTTPELRASAKAHRHAMTPAERVLWDALKERQLAGLKFRAQHPVGPFILDFYCPQHRLVVEVDGPIHDDPDQSAYDTYRTAQLQAFGLTVLRLRNEDILTNLPTALARITAAAPSNPDTPPPARKTRRPPRPPNPGG